MLLCKAVPTNAALPLLVSAFIKATQAFCVMGVITAGIMFISAVIYNFVHAVPKRFALGMFSFFAIATGEISKTYILSSVRLEEFPLCMQGMLLCVLTTCFLYNG